MLMSVFGIRIIFLCCVDNQKEERCRHQSRAVVRDKSMGCLAGKSPCRITQKNKVHVCWCAQVQRVEVARLLLSLASASALIRDELEEDADRKKALRRELNDVRIKIRRCV